MKKIKKYLAGLLMLVMVVVSMAACGGGAGSDNAHSDESAKADTNTAQDKAAVDLKKHKIGIAHYTDSGKGVEAIKAYCAGISEATGCEFVFTTLSTYDEATNLTEIQSLISSGCEGIIMTADMGTTSIIAECEAAGVYLAGFLCDYNQSFNTAFDATFGSDYFLGTVCDGTLDKHPMRSLWQIRSSKMVTKT